MRLCIGIESVSKCCLGRHVRVFAAVTETSQETSLGALTGAQSHAAWVTDWQGVRKIKPKRILEVLTGARGRAPMLLGKLTDWQLVIDKEPKRRFEVPTGARGRAAWLAG